MSVSSLLIITIVSAVSDTAVGAVTRAVIRIVGSALLHSGISLILQASTFTAKTAAKALSTASSRQLNVEQRLDGDSHYKQFVTHALTNSDNVMQKGVEMSTLTRASRDQDDAFQLQNSQSPSLTCGSELANTHCYSASAPGTNSPQTSSASN
jgi:hypothetical protein